MKDQETKAYALRLPAPVYNRVKNLSFFTERSMNEIITAAVTDYLDRVGDQDQLDAVSERMRTEYRTVLDKLRDL
jgi:predicted DNA-binding protein